MPQTIHALLTQYLSEVQEIYGSHLKTVILYDSYAREDLETANLTFEAGQYLFGKEKMPNDVGKRASIRVGRRSF